MNNTQETPAAVEQPTQSVWTQSYTIVSDRHVDYENLSAFEALSMSAVLVLAVIAGTMTSINL